MVELGEAVVFLKSVSERTIPGELAKATGTTAQRLFNIYYRLSMIAMDLARIYEIAKCLVDSGAPCYSREKWKTCNICSHFWVTIADGENTVTRIKQSAVVSFNGEEAVFKVGSVAELRITAGSYRLRYKNMVLEVNPKNIDAVRRNLDKALYVLRGVEGEVRTMKNALEGCVKLKSLTC